MQHQRGDERAVDLDAVQAEAGALKRLQAGTSAELGALLPAILARAFSSALLHPPVSEFTGSAS